MLIRSTLIICCLSMLPAWGAQSNADEAYQLAKTEYQKLKQDEKRRGLRHHWLNVGKRFDVVATKHPKSERAPEALFMSGQLFADLSRLSQNSDDLSAAERSWRKLIDAWPKHKLSDDAALGLARLLADRRNDPKGARKVLERSMDVATDKKKEMQKLLASLPVPVEPKKEKPLKVKELVAKSAPAAKPVRAAPVAIDASTEEEESPAPTTTRVSALAEALRKLREETPTAPTNLENDDESAPSAQGRRTPVALRPEPVPVDAAPVDEDAAVEPSDASAIASLQEKLRDVRVGARKPDPAARSRFAALAKHQQADELSLAQQLGLKVRRVIIDAGHGGHDTGAIGPTGVREKDVALGVVLKLKDKLEALGLEVVLTRDDDTFVALDQRTRIANKEHGDLFISIHCNAAPSKNLRGVETYTLNTSSNRYSVRLAARENATTERGINDLQYILADLATKANTGESQRLAESVQRSLIRGLSKEYKGVRDLGTKEALFVVLLGAKMPSILVETSFLSNPEDEQRLASEEYQQALADNVAEAVESFLEARNKVAQVD
ncbi:MAG: N-acetylmuramoyl-L-alanine amidase [Myxococcales bacterium]|nr:N-acetylmuramoyl-L-alanine amidase [Myxococcales bacterium]